MVNLYTKFEVSRCTRYEAVNGGAKCRKLGGFGSLGGTQGHRQCHDSHSIERMQLPPTKSVGCARVSDKSVDFVWSHT